MKVCSSLLTGTAALTKLKEYAPIVVEGGTGRRDQRDPAEVARRVAAALRPRITERQTILVTQGDPLEETGISAITRAVADELAIPRALVTLPASIDPEHAPNAPREGVILEVSYDALADEVVEGGLHLLAQDLFTLLQLEKFVDSFVQAFLLCQQPVELDPLQLDHHDELVRRHVTDYGIGHLRLSSSRSGLRRSHFSEGNNLLGQRVGLFLMDIMPACVESPTR